MPAFDAPAVVPDPGPAIRFLASIRNLPPKRQPPPQPDSTR